MDFQKLHGQHRAIVRLASDLMSVVGEVRTRQDALEARLLLERLDRVLGLHLELEDRTMMPALMSSPDPKTRALAADCVEEMGGLAQVWNGHLATWAVEQIHGEPDRFASATRSLMEAVARRVDREERELYPVAEAVADRAA
jgi:hemerythrin-like domain-containing protein